MKRAFSILLLTFLFVGVLQAQEIPELIEFSKTDYQANHQNWDFAEDCQGNLIVANTAGVLHYNGHQWQKIPIANQAKVRSVYVGPDCRIYAGGYQTFGFIDMSHDGGPVYQSLSDSIFRGEEEIWQIFGNDQGVLFQTFSNAYFFDFESVQVFTPDNNVMLGEVINDRFYLPKIGAGLFGFKNGKFQDLLIEDLLPEQSLIAAISGTIHPNEIVIATRKNGIYLLQDLISTTEANKEFNELIKSVEVNKLIHLEYGGYAIGTILNGVYIVDEFFNLKYHINKKNGLANNTILALYEDHKGNLIVGLNKGINIIRLQNKSRYNYDYNGQLGTIFDAHVFQDHLYIASNRGLFKTTMDGSFRLVDKSQGQTWSLVEASDRLLIGHNQGTYQLNDNGDFVKISDVTGGRHMNCVAPDLILQASYTGLLLLKKVGSHWVFEKRVTNGNLQFKDFIVTEEHIVYGLSPYNQLYKLQLSEDYSEVIDLELLEYEDMSSSAMFIEDHESKFLIGAQQNYEIRDGSLTSIPGMVKESSISANSRCILDVISSSAKEEYPEEIPLIHDVSTGITREYLVVEQSGYRIVPEQELCLEESQVYSNLDKVAVNGKRISINASTTELKAKENDLIFFLKKSNNLFTASTSKFKLEGWSENWSAVPSSGRIEFMNLSHGSYRLLLHNEIQTEVFSFRILPKWYLSKWAWIVYALLLMGGTVLFIRMYKWRLFQKSRRILREKAREIEAERIRLKNKELQNEVELKSKMLANSAMTLIKKNELLGEMDKELSQIPVEAVTSKQFKNRIRSLIRKNKNSDQDWQIFETSFSEIHQDFITRLKETHPTINAAEVRMAAYIKMDLSSKEIAPLMHISPRSVENKRYRLRKKLELPKSRTLKRYLQNFQ